VPEISGCYSKERFFKIPALDRFVGDTHECVPPKNTPQIHMTGVAFHKLPKTPEQEAKKASRVLWAMRRKVKQDPGTPRWRYYLGDALLSMGKLEPALVAFLECSDMRGWDEESAWACFRAATILADTGRPFDAVEACAKGLARHPGMAELAWLAGEISFSAGWLDKAVYWARIAIANGGDRLIRPRTHYRHVPGTTTAPYQLLSKAYDALGMVKEKAHCDQVLNDLTHKEVVHA
jgi:tetratricopeptide (TPR) repeat protein